MSKPSRMEILELLSNGKISAVEAADLLSNVDKPAEKMAAPPPPPAAKMPAPAPEAPSNDNAGSGPSWFRVRVSNLETGKNQVNVNIPIKMMKFGLKLGSRFSEKIDKNMDWNELTTMMSDGSKGILVDVQDVDSNEHVQVYLD